MKLRLKALLAIVLVAHSAHAQQRPVIGAASFISPAAGTVPLTISGAAGQTANLQNWASSSPAIVASVSATGVLAVSGISLTSTEPRLTFSESDQGADGKLWDFDINGGVFSLRTRTDADGAGTSAFTVTRSGTALTAFTVTGPLSVSSGATLTTAASTLKFYGSTTAEGALRGNTVGGLGVLEARLADASAYADLLVLDEAYAAGWNGNIAVPTKNALYDKIEALALGYALSFSSASANPSDAASFYLGSIPSVALSSTADTQKIYIPRAGTIKKAYVLFNNAGPGTAENSTIYVRLNNTTDTAIAATVDNSNAVQTVSNTGLTIAVAAGDYVEIKWITPTWATDPTGTSIGGVLFVE